MRGQTPAWRSGSEGQPISMPRPCVEISRACAVTMNALARVERARLSTTGARDWM